MSTTGLVLTTLEPNTSHGPFGNGAVKYVCAQDDVTSPRILYVRMLVI